MIGIGRKSLTALSLAVGITAFAQEGGDTIPGLLEQAKSDIVLLKNMKISGYVQAQGQWLEKQDDKSYKVPSVAGGNFDPYQDMRFGVRRGRVKFAYSASPLSQAVVQIDATEKGVSMKDAYLKFTEPFAKTLSVTAGVFNRPFGYEVEFSSSSRETPERSRMVQSLFPQERDLGVMATVQAPKTSRFNFLKLDVACIAGNGINQDLDRFKDVVGRLNMSKSFFEEKLKLSGGGSYYWGGFANFTDNVYSVKTDTAGVKYFDAQKGGNKNNRSLKQLMGVDAQVSFDAPWGMLTLRGEYIQGQQPSLKGNSTYPTTALYESSTTNNPVIDTKTGQVTGYTVTNNRSLGDTYIRQVSGYYFYFVQNIMQSRHQLVFKYDVYDPNTDVKGTDVDGKKIGASDIKYTTMGLGYILKIDANTKLMIYADKVENEKTKIGESKDNNGNVTDPGFLNDRKDNVLTVRLQYKF